MLNLAYQRGMSRQEWNDIAHELGDRREMLRRSRPVIASCSSRMQHLAWSQRLEAFDDATRVVAGVLKRRSSRFDESRFLKSVGVGRR